MIFEIHESKGTEKVKIVLRGKTFFGSKEPVGPVVGVIGGIPDKKSKEIGTAAGTKVYDRTNKLLAWKKGYLQTDQGCIAVYSMKPAVLLFLILLALLVVLFFVCYGIGDFPDDNSGGLPSAGQTSSISSSESGSNNDIEDGGLSPDLPDEEIKKRIDELAVDSKYRLRYNKTPGIKNGKLNIRFENNKVNSINVMFEIVIGGETVYKSGNIRPGQYIENATLNKSVPNSTDGEMIVNYLDSQNNVYNHTLVKLKLKGEQK